MAEYTDCRAAGGDCGAVLRAGRYSTIVCAADPPITWLTGEKLRQQLDQKVSITWSARSGIPFRQALTHLSQRSKWRFWSIAASIRTRRSSSLPTMRRSDATFKLIASKLSIGEAQVGSVIYFGPEATARRVRTVSVLRHGEVDSAAVGASIAVLAIAAWKWDDLPTPSDLLAGLAKQCKIEIKGLDRIPHDLWAADDLPPLNLSDRLTLVAAQFDLTFSIDPSGESVSLVEIPRRSKSATAMRSMYRRPEANAVIAKLSKACPRRRFVSAMASCRFAVARRIRISSSVARRPAGEADHGDERDQGLHAAGCEDGRRRFDQHAREELNLDVQFDDAAIQAAGLSLKTEVKVNVKMWRKTNYCMPCWPGRADV